MAKEGSTGIIIASVPRDRAVGRLNRFCLRSVTPGDWNSLFANALTNINRQQMIANGWTVKFDRIALTPRMISCDRCGTVAPNRGWIEGRH
jgi:hypothetical protein